MKNFALSVLLALTTLPAFAGNEGPNAAPMPPPIDRVIARKATAVGLAPANYPNTIILTISETGRVIETASFFDGHKETVAIATLAATVLAKLKVDIAAIRPGNLVDAEPEAPDCLDAPFTNYEVITADDNVNLIGSSQACKTLRKAGYPRADENVIDTLDALSRLNH